MKQNDRILIIAGLVAGLVGLVVMVGFIGQGNVRHVEIFWTEKVEQTIVFQEVNGETQIQAVKGVKGDNNPTLISRTSFVYVLTVINNGTTHHRLYIDGFNVQTDLLEPGQQDTITIYPDKEGEFTYYDKRQYLEPLGKIKIYSAVPSDEFTGFLKDMI